MWRLLSQVRFPSGTITRWAILLCSFWSVSLYVETDTLIQELEQVWKKKIAFEAVEKTRPHSEHSQEDRTIVWVPQKKVGSFKMLLLYVSEGFWHVEGRQWVPKLLAAGLVLQHDNSPIQSCSSASFGCFGEQFDSQCCHCEEDEEIGDHTSRMSRLTLTFWERETRERESWFMVRIRLFLVRGQRDPKSTARFFFHSTRDWVSTWSSRKMFQTRWSLTLYTAIYELSINVCMLK